MTSGGNYWGEVTRGFFDELVFRKTSHELQKGHPIIEEHAWNFIKAAQYGGCSEAEAWKVIADHDCTRFGHMIELQDTDNLPTRWFRNAWVRNHNGAIAIDLEKAKPIQWDRLRIQLVQENTKREQSLFDLPKIKIPVNTFKSYIRNASSIDELERIWPQELPKKQI
jgi:hypothetical protein